MIRWKKRFTPFGVETTFQDGSLRIDITPKDSRYAIRIYDGNNIELDLSGLTYTKAEWYGTLYIEEKAKMKCY